MTYFSTSIPPFPFPKRKYVFEVETQDDELRVFLSSEAYRKKKKNDWGDFDDQGSESDDKYIDGFYDWMKKVCESLGGDVSEVAESLWSAGGCCGSDDIVAANADMQNFIDFLRGHPNFVEDGERKEEKADAYARLKLNSDQIKEKVYEHIVNSCPMSVWEAEYRDRLHLDFIKNLSLEEYKRKQLGFGGPCKNLAKKTAKSFERLSKKRDKATGNWLRTFRLCLLLMDHTAYVTTDPDDYNILEIEYVRDRPCFNPDHTTKLASNESVKPVTPPSVSEQAPAPTSDRDAARQLRQKMDVDFMRESFAARRKYMSLTEALSFYMLSHFEKDFFTKYPEYIPLTKGDDRWERGTKLAQKFDTLFTNPVFVAHLEALMKLCDDFKPACNVVDD